MVRRELISQSWQKSPKYCIWPIPTGSGTSWYVYGRIVTEEDTKFDGLMQERRNPIAITLELRLSYTNQSIYSHIGWLTSTWVISSVVYESLVDAYYNIQITPQWVSNSPYYWT